MCLPAAALPALAIASSVASAGGQLYGGMQANAQGKYESRIAKRNAALEVEGSRASIEAGVGERRDYWRKIGAIKGQNIASMAANGIDVGFGAGERIQQDTNMLAREDARKLYSNIEERTRGHHINASNYVAESKAAKSRGKAALVGSMFGAASSLLGGATQYSKLKAKQ
jgi:hypothetical protein